MYSKLMKVFFKEGFSIKKLFGTDIKSNKGKTILIGVLILYGVGSILFVFGFMFYDLGEVLEQLGLIDVLLIYAFMYATALSVMFVLFRANGYIFNYKDYEILEPLPIKTKTVVLAKTTVMMIFIYLSLFIFLSPMFFAYFYHSGFDLLGIILAILGSLAIPIIPIVIFSFLSLLIARITSKFRKNNLLNIILLFVLFLGIMYLSMSANSMSNNNPLFSQQTFMSTIGTYYPPIKWFVQAVNDHNILSFGYLILSNVAIFTIFIFGIQKLVVSTNQRSLTKVTRKNNKAIKHVRRSLIGSIAIKESRKFFNTPIYALNVGFGPVILFVLGIASLFFKDQILGYFANFGLIGLENELIVLILIGFCIGMTYSTAISLSLEGKQFWLIKSLPIKPITVMYGKMLFNLLLALPVAIISLLLFSYTLETSIIRIFLMLLLVMSLAFGITIFGSVINLFVPKFDFRNPAEVVKQSAGAMLGLFGSWIILFLNGLIFYLVTKSMSFELGIVFMTLFNLIMGSGLLIFINKKVESLFIKFEV